MDVQSVTHQVTNQSPQLIRNNALLDDPVLQQGLEQHGAAWAIEHVSRYGAKMSELEQLGFEANKFLPELQTHDRYGHRVDCVEFHHAYHSLMSHAKEAGIHSLPWASPKKGAHVARFALEYIHGQAEAGTCCPLSMTYAGIPLLKQNKTIEQHWLPKALAYQYESQNVPVSKKNSVTLGMAMTEKQGGSDVRANQTIATSVQDDVYHLIGHKWFCSAPMCDGFFVTAKTADKLSCFLVPRFKRDETKNPMHVMRLKDKLGNKANASSEVEFNGAEGYLIGDEGKGIQTIIQMVALTRFDCIAGSTALMRQAFVQATHHAMHRSAFGNPLIKQPLMQNVLAHCAIELQASQALCFRLASLLDEDSEQSHVLLRLVTALGKYWVCKRTPQVVVELLECLGGAGFVEDFMLARLYREAPLNAIWEGCGNIQCLDVLRTLVKEPTAIEMLFAELHSNAQGHQALVTRVNALQDSIAKVDEFCARGFVESLIRTYQASLLVTSADSLVAESYISMQDDSSKCLGALSDQKSALSIIAKQWPAIN